MCRHFPVELDPKIFFEWYLAKGATDKLCADIIWEFFEDMNLPNIDR